jgi:2-polyprenyl-6-methoxyphenol hydroxylase-like FAD-dependent oxidoreductase
MESINDHEVSPMVPQAQGLNRHSTDSASDGTLRLISNRTIRRSGFLDEIRQKTWDLKTLAWRKIGGEILASLENKDDSNPDRFLLWPVHKLSNFFLEKVLEQPTASVHMSCPVSGVGQNEDVAWIDIDIDGKVTRMEADFVVGCDGANSIVRRSLFGDSFPGHTWDRQLVAINVTMKPWIFDELLIVQDHL